MIRFENAVSIDRRTEDVFAFLADFRNVPRWNYAIVETRQVSEGPVGVGTRYRQHRSVPRPSEEELEITTFDPPARLGFRGTLGPFSAEVDYRLEPDDDGTRLTNEMRLQPRGPLALVGKLAAGRVGDAVASNLLALKQILEGER